MEVIETRIDTSSDEFKRNQEAMLALVEDLRAELKKAKEDRSPKANQRHTSQGKLPLEKRLELLLDNRTAE